MKNVLAYLTGCPWAITREKMDGIFEIIQQEHDLEAVAARLGKPLDNTGNRVERRNDTAVIDVNGPIFRYANLFTDVSGATSIELLSRDFTTALEDPSVEAILLNIDSPGGEVNGVGELAQRIYAGRKKKPIWAYVGGEAASGGYWLASAASKIVAYETSRTGSIGVIASVLDDTSRQKRRGVIKHDIISSQSPHKRLDPTSESGQSKLQEMVDEMADTFIAHVARNRGTTSDHVIAHYGEGFTMMGPRALKAGMVDELGTYEGALAALDALMERSTRTFSIAPSGGTHVEGEQEGFMADNQQPVVTQSQTQQPQVNEAEVRAAAVQTERQRINAILGLEEANGREELARTMALESDMSVEDARRFLAKAPKAAAPAPPTQAQQTDQFSDYMRTVKNPKVGVESEQEDDVAAEVRSIVAFLPSAQRRKVG